MVYSSTDTIDGREEPRPAVAPFSSDYNGMIDDDASVEVTYPPEKVEEEDEVMMDFVAGR